jgi:DNA-binding GntR family transcriptional regulator
MKRDGNELDNIMELFEEEGKNLSSEDSLTAKINLGEQLHNFIIKSAGNSLIDQAMKPLRLQIYRIWQGSIRIPERINKAFLEHKEIIRAIRDGDGELAEKLMRKHLSHAYHDCVNIMPHV